MATNLALSEEIVGISTAKPPEPRSVKTDQGYLVPYREQIPGTDVFFEMVPIPAGEFLLGSPAEEADRSEDEGPQVRVSVPACWVGKCEVTWAEYHAYMNTYQALKSLNKMRAELRRFGDKSEKLNALPTVKKFLQHESLDIDAVTAPTPLYDPDTTYAYGEEASQPAVTMSQFGARQYTKWLSGITGREYRLLSEVEWEYAARAGSTTPYGFRIDESLEDYAWFTENSDDELHAVGMKKPNAWGLHDMHGNVAEWVLDEYREDQYAQLGQQTTAEKALLWPTKLFPRVIRGGSIFDEAPLCRSAARQQSDDPEWTLSDPNLPVSPWWLTEDAAAGIGFRIVRPLTPMSAAQRKKAWDPDFEDLRLDVADRLREGRGTRSGVNLELPAVLKELEAAGFVE